MSIKSVAKMAGVSIATVSRYFNKPDLLKKQTRDKVEKAIAALNYQPNTLAQNFRRGKSGLIVIVVYNIGNPLYENFTQAITPIAQSKGYDILIKETNRKNLDIKYYQDMLSSKQADGLIVMIDLPKLDGKTHFMLANLPIVFIKEERPANDDLPHYIGFDNYEAAETAAEHLINLGHKNIVCISSEENNTACLNRQSGFIFAIQKAKLLHERVITVRDNAEAIEEVVNSILQMEPKITAIFCTRDDLAIEVLSVLKQMNIEVPKRISVIGFNNIRYAAKTHPPLTTIEQPFAEITQQAIKVLCEKIENLPQTNDTEDIQNSTSTFNHRLIIRSSTASPLI